MSSSVETELVQLQAAPTRPQSIDLVDGNQDEDNRRQRASFQYPSGIRFVFLTLGLVLGILIAALDSTILATSIPAITDQFHTVKDIGWYSAGYGITTAAFQTTWGKGYAHFPIMRVLTLAIAFFELGNTICALAQNSSAFIVGRLVAGVGGGGILTGCFIMIALSIKPQQRAAYMAVVGVTFGSSSVAGPLLGGFLTDTLDWRWCFWINLPIGTLAVVLLALTFRQPVESRSPPQRLREKLLSLDPMGAGLVLGSLTCLILALQFGDMPSSWHSWRTISSLTCSVVLVALFVINERFMGPRAMVEGRFFRNRRIRTNLLFQFLLAGLFFPLTYLYSIQFQSVGNASATQSGLRLIPMILGVSIFTMVANGLLTFWRRFPPFLIFGSAIGSVGVILIQALGAGASYGDWIAYEILIGIGVGMTLQVPLLANQEAVGMDDIAAITSLTLFVENVGTAIFIAATETALSNGLIKALASYNPGLSPELVLHTGVARIRETFERHEVEGILQSYLKGCQESQFIPIACGTLAFCLSLTLIIPSRI